MAEPIRLRGAYLDWGQLNLEGTPPTFFTFTPNLDMTLAVGFVLVGGVFRPSAANVDGSLIVDASGRTLSVSAPGSPGVTPPGFYPWANPPLTKSQKVTAALNQIVLPAAGVGIRNVVVAATVALNGSGVMPTVANPLVVTITDGATVVSEVDLSGATVGAAVPGPAGNVGIIGSPNTAMTISVPAPNANVTSILTYAATTF